MTITIVNRTRSTKLKPDFGVWLRSEFTARGMNQTEFAQLLGVGHGTVSRWVNGRIPDAALIERIADVLVLDYDDVATKAGYRPRELDGGEDDIIKRELLPLMRQIDWSRGLALEAVKINLEFWRNTQAKEHER